jgi:hypothetical protein
MMKIASLSALLCMVVIVWAQHTPCGSTPPGFQHFMRGYDLSTIDLLNPDSMNWMKPILTQTCDVGTTYVNDYNGKTYTIPDQLDAPPLNVGGDQSQAYSVLTRDSQSFKEQLAITMKESAFFGLFSSSQSFSEAASMLLSEYVYAGIRSSHMSAYEMSLHEFYRTDLMNLSSDAQFLAGQPKRVQ